MAPSSGGYNTGLSWQPQGLATPRCKAGVQGTVDRLGRPMAWCARRAMEIRQDRLRDLLMECTKSTGVVAAPKTPCLCPRTVSLQHVKRVLFTRLTHMFRNQMARTFGLTSGLAWPNLTAACPGSWLAWNMKTSRVWTRRVQSKHSL